MRLIDLLNCMGDMVEITITTGKDEWDFEVYVNCTLIKRIPADVLNLIRDRCVRDIYTINDVIRINIV